MVLVPLCVGSSRSREGRRGSEEDLWGLLVLSRDALLQGGLPVGFETACTVSLPLLLAGSPGT